MNEIRFLEHTKDVGVLTEAWGWQNEAPRWFKESQTENETLKDFLEPDENELLLGVFIERDITAVIRLTQAKPMVFMIDLFAKRKTDWEVLLQAGQSMKEYLFEKGVRGFFGWIPRKNRPIVKLYECLGFVHRGIKCYRGSMHGKPIKWLLMEAENPLQ